MREIYIITTDISNKEDTDGYPELKMMAYKKYEQAKKRLDELTK